MNMFLLTFSLFLSTLFQAERPIHLFMIGDSTMCNWSAKYYPETGWGQVLQDYFTEEVIVSNHAKSGKSSKSFRDQGFWQKVLDELQDGDFVIIQFGHNDSKEDNPDLYTEPYGTYTDNLITYIEEVRAKGATPILATSIARRRFNSRGEFYDTHGDYPDAVRSVALLQNVPLLDLHKKTVEVLKEAGPGWSKRFFLHFGPGVYSNWPEGKEDNTHLSPEGAHMVASLAVDDIRNLSIKPLQEYLTTILASPASGESELKVYPNPVDEVLTLSGNTTIGEYQISDLSGKIILNGYGAEIDVRLLRHGTYLLTIPQEGTTLRFLKN